MPRKVIGRSSRPKTRSRRASSRMPPFYGSAHEDQVGRPMVRFLLDAYSAEQIDRMFDEESRSLSPSSPSPTEGKSEPSMLPEPESQDMLSNLASESKGSGSSSGTSGREIFKSKTIAIPDTNTAQQREEQIITTAQAAPTSTSHLVHTFGSVIRGGSAVWQKEFFCCFCAEQGFAVNCTRAHDLRRHLDDTHNCDTLWICVQSDCRRVFPWLGFYKSHMTTSHPRSRFRIGESETVELCSQTVFSCGFDECEKVFEARSVLEAPQTKKRYTDHILNHFRRLRGPANWTFSTRVRNLLKQTDLVGIWPPAELSEEEIANLSWDPQTAGVVQKQLETRHLGDRDFLVRNVLALGSNPSREIQLAQAKISIPILRECSEPMHHKTTVIAPIPATALIPPSVPMMASGSAGNGVSLVGPGYADIVNSGFQQQPFVYPDPMQHMVNSIVPQHQQYNAADWSDPMQWINFDGEDNRRLM